MEVINYTINGNSYTFIKDGYADVSYAESLDKLSDEIFAINFKAFRDKGYMGDNCHFYSLLKDGEVVSHVTVTIQQVLFNDQTYVAAQLGTIMTAPKYRKQGLSSWLIEKAIGDWDEQCDILFLYANDTVLDFYPKFGFKTATEFQTVAQVDKLSNLPQAMCRKLDLKVPEDYELFKNIATNANPNYQLSFVEYNRLLFFYCDCLEAFSHHIFYFEHLNTLALAEYDDDVLIIAEVVSTEPVIPIEAIVGTFLTDAVTRVELRFNPKEKIEGWNKELFHEDDSTLMIRSNKAISLFEENKLIISPLSHT